MSSDRVTSGWRLFSLNRNLVDHRAGEGWLLSPLAAAGLLGELPVEEIRWDDATMRARCSGGHPAPAADCTCGIRATVDLAELLGHAQRTMPSGRRLIEDAPVLALVDVAGVVLPGTDMPSDDPHTTVRAAQATIRELHVPDDPDTPRMALSLTYNVPVRTWPADAWPHKVRALDPWFVELVRRSGIGNKDLSGDISTLVDLAKDAAHSIATRQLMRHDAAMALFDSKARPTWAQAKAFVDAALHVYAPHAAEMADPFSVARPLTLGEVMGRAGQAMVRSALAQRP